jgi:hypothetical protein
MPSWSRASVRAALSGSIWVRAQQRSSSASGRVSGAGASLGDAAYKVLLYHFMDEAALLCGGVKRMPVSVVSNRVHSTSPNRTPMSAPAPSGASSGRSKAQSGCRDCRRRKERLAVTPATCLEIRLSDAPDSDFFCGNIQLKSLCPLSP